MTAAFPVPMVAPLPVRAVVLDLDDTLYPQASFLRLAWDAVAGEAAARGVALEPFRRALDQIAAQGSDQGAIIDRALALIAAPVELTADLVEVFRRVRPVALPTYPGVTEAVRRLASRVPLALVTDGHPDQQRAKLAATGLEDCFRVVVCTDDHGRQFRKPDPLGLHLALHGLDTDAEVAVMIGDRPDKDMAVAERVGLRSIRVRQGEHRHQPDGPAWCSYATTPEALGHIERCLGAG